MGLFLKYMLNEGRSYAVDKMNIAVWGPGVFNIDSSNALKHAYFDYKDDEGKEHDDGMATITGSESSGPLSYQQEKTGQIRETVLSLQIPKGSKNNAIKAIKAALKPFKLDAEILPEWRKPQTRK